MGFGVLDLGSRISVLECGVSGVDHGRFVVRVLNLLALLDQPVLVDSPQLIGGSGF